MSFKSWKDAVAQDLFEEVTLSIGGEVVAHYKKEEKKQEKNVKSLPSKQTEHNKSTGEGYFLTR